MSECRLQLVLLAKPVPVAKGKKPFRAPSARIRSSLQHSGYTKEHVLVTASNNIDLSIVH